MRVFDGLEDVNWQDLSHAYGSAEDVPRYLRALLSEDESEWDEAFTFFFQSVWHQGTVYSVTAHVIPFLVELLTVETVIHREGILYLLEALSNGSSYAEVHYHLDPELADEIYAGQGTDYDSQLRLERSYVVSARNAVLERHEVYLELLEHDNPKLVGFAIYLLSNLHELPIDHFQLFREIYRRHDSNEIKNSALHGIRALDLDPGIRQAFFESIFDVAVDGRLKSTAALGAFEAAGRQVRPDIFEYLLDVYQFLERETEYGWLQHDDSYPDPWGPGISTTAIARACVAGSSLENLSEVRALASVIEGPSAVFDLMKDLLLELFSSQVPSKFGSSSTWRDGTYIVTFTRGHIDDREWPVAENATVADTCRDLFELLLSLDKFWAVKSNLLNVFGFPHSRSKLKKLVDQSG